MTKTFVTGQGDLSAFVQDVIDTAVAGAKLTGSATAQFFAHGVDGKLRQVIAHNLSFDNTNLVNGQGYGRLVGSSTVTAFLGAGQLQQMDDVNGVEVINPNITLVTQSVTGQDADIAAYARGLGQETTALLNNGANIGTIKGLAAAADGAVFADWDGTLGFNVNGDSSVPFTGSFADFVAAGVNDAINGALIDFAGSSLNFTVRTVNGTDPDIGGGGTISSGFALTNPTTDGSGAVDDQITATNTLSYLRGGGNGYAGVTVGSTVVGATVDLGSFAADATAGILLGLIAGGANITGAVTTRWVSVGTRASGAATYTSG